MSEQQQPGALERAAAPIGARPVSNRARLTASHREEVMGTLI